MASRTSVVRWVGLGLAALLGVSLIGVAVVARTGWAHDYVRGAVEDAIRGQVRGSFEIGGLSGNLLDAVTLEDIAVEDTSGRPVLGLESLTVDYALAPLLRRRILIQRLELVEPRIVLDQGTDGRWNVAELPARSAEPDTAAGAGFGSWIRIEEASIRDGRVTLRTPWSPTPDPTGTAVDTARVPFERVRGSLHVVREVRDLDASLSDLVVAHPTEPRSGRLESLETTALPFEPPALRIRDLEGRFTLAGDSLRVDDVAMELPDSRLTADARMGLESGRIDALIDLDRLSLADLAWLDPTLPGEGSVRARARLTRSEEEIRIDLPELEAEVGGGHLAGGAEVAVGEVVRVGATELRFTGLDAALAERLTGADVPLQGSLQGEVELSPVEGDVDGSIRIDATLRHDLPEGSGRARISGVAVLGQRAARDLEVRLDPLPVATLEPFVGPLPVAGDVRGSVVVDGGWDGTMRTALDLEHTSARGRTRVTGTASTRPTRPDPPLRAELRLPVVSLATVGAFAPEAELRGTASGAASASGTFSRPSVTLSLAVDGGGRMEVSGALAPAGPEPRYDVRARLDSLDAGAVSDLAPPTTLNGTVEAEIEGAGAGDLPRVDGRLDLEASRVGLLEEVHAVAQAALEDGLLRVSRAEITSRSSRASLSGELGLEPQRRGRMELEVTVDSLSRFAELLPEDTTAADSLPSFAGRVRLDGAVSGNLDTIDAGVAATLSDVRAMGVRARDRSIRLDGRDLRSERRDLAAELALEGVRVAGFDFDSIGTRAEYAGSPAEGEGFASVTVVQDSLRDYRFRAEYGADLDESEIRLDNVVVRLDTARWASADPSRIAWGPAGLVVDSFHLSDARGGRIVVDGRLSEDGGDEEEAESLAVRVKALPVSRVLAVLQDSVRASGLLSLRVDATALPPDTRLEGTIALDDPAYDDTPVPALRASVDYEPGDLAAELRLLGSSGMRTSTGDTLLVAEGRTEVDLFGAGEEEASRSLSAAIRVDSLRVERLPRFSDAVSDIRGRVWADVAVGGTLDDPEPDGRIDLDLGRLDVDPAGVEFRDIAGTLRIRDGSVRLDSLVAWSAGGTVRVTGTAGLPAATEPELDLEVTARDAQVLDNDDVRNLRVDGEVRLTGPLDGLTVDGQVRVLEGILFVPETQGEVIDLEAPLSRRALAEAGVPPERIPEPSPLLQGLRMNVELVATRNTWVRAPDGTVEVYTPESGDPFLIQYRGGEQGVVMDGVLNVDRGEYAFAGRRFELTSGSATFLPSSRIDPLLQLTATHEVLRAGRESLSIQINVGGRLFEPRFVLTSDATPPLSQTDLISYLVFGSPSTSITQAGGSGLGGEGAEGLGALASQQLGSMAIGALVEEAYASIEADAVRAGLDVFRVAPAELPEELALEGYFENLLRGTRLDVGTYLGPRLFLGASGRATTEVWPGFTLGYRSPGGFRLSGLWEPRYLPSSPGFDPERTATETRALGLFLFWEWRGAGRPATGSAGGSGSP